MVQKKVGNPELVSIVSFLLILFLIANKHASGEVWMLETQIRARPGVPLSL